MLVNQRGGLNLAFISRLRITAVLPTAILAHSESLMMTWSKAIPVLGKHFAPCDIVLQEFPAVTLYVPSLPDT